MKPVVHFEIPFDDFDRAKSFYQTLFGWQFEKMPGDMVYYFVKTKENDADPGINGGFTQRQMPQQMPVNYISVDNIDASLAQVDSLGGKIIIPKTAIPGMGYFAILMDTENNPIGIWMDDAQAK